MEEFPDGSVEGRDEDAEAEGEGDIQHLEMLKDEKMKMMMAN